MREERVMAADPKKGIELAHPRSLRISPPASSPKHQRIAVRRHLNTRAPAQPEPNEPDLTGRYEDTEGKITFQINHAGRHIECWASIVGGRSVQWRDGASMRYVFTLGGDWREDGSYELYDSESPENGRGRLVVEGPDDPYRLELTPPGQQPITLELEFIARRTTMSEAAVLRTFGIV